MNIFILHPNITISAQRLFELDERRANKQIVEIAQCIATGLSVMHNLTIPKMDGTPYTPTHHNHPCNKWVAESPTNLFATVMYGYSLCSEYERLKNKKHGCERAILKAYQLMSFLHDSLPYSHNVLGVVFSQMPRFGKTMPNTGNIFDDCRQHIKNKQESERI